MKTPENPTEPIILPTHTHTHCSLFVKPHLICQCTFLLLRDRLAGYQIARVP